MRKVGIYLNEIYHIYNRGTSKMDIFLDDKDYLRFIEKMTLFAQTYFVDILTFCLMPNHFHIILTSNDEKANIPIFMKSLQLSHSLYYNCKYNHSGNVFQGCFKNKLVSRDEYLSTLVDYVYNNPVRKGLVARKEYWPYGEIVNDTALKKLGITV